MTQTRHFALIGAGMAGISCARTLMQAGHRVTVFEKSGSAGGRMSTRRSPFGTFDHGAQYFTVRDDRFAQAIATTPDVCKPWSANTVRVLDARGLVAAAGLPARESHWVATPGMNGLVRAWADPLAQQQSLELHTRVTRIERDALDGKRWQLQTTGPDDTSRVFAGFDAVLLAMPSVQSHDLLKTSKKAPALVTAMSEVKVAPCWTLMLAFPQAMQPGMTTLGPQWNAARSTHHRIAWLARESSKPKRGMIERWTVQASAAWSQEHLQDPALALCPDHPAPGRQPPVGRQGPNRCLRRLVPGPPRRKRLCVGTGACTQSPLITLAALRPPPQAPCMRALWWRHWPAGWMRAPTVGSGWYV